VILGEDLEPLHPQDIKVGDEFIGTVISNDSATRLTNLQRVPLPIRLGTCHMCGAVHVGIMTSGMCDGCTKAGKR
jgi:hypothetical protein